MSRNKTLLQIADLIYNNSAVPRLDDQAIAQADMIVGFAPETVVSAIHFCFVKIDEDGWISLTAAARQELLRRMISIVSQTLEQWSEVHIDTLADAIGEILDPDGLFVDLHLARINRALVALEFADKVSLCRESGVITRSW